jgi:hypothetical protein
MRTWMWVCLWLAAGVPAAMFAGWSWRLTFGRGLRTLGDIIAIIVGSLLPPMSLMAGIVWFMSWAFDDPSGQDEDRRRDHESIECQPWPKWWWWAKYRWHLRCRWVWYLGKPPVEGEGSDWVQYGPAKWARETADRLSGQQGMPGDVPLPMSPAQLILDRARRQHRQQSGGGVKP